MIAERVHADAARAVRARRARAVHRRVDRHRARRPPTRRPSTRAARRRRRDVPRQGRRQGPPRRVRRAHARAGDAPAGHGERPAPGDRRAARWRSSTSRSCRRRPAASSASRRSCAGRTAAAARRAGRVRPDRRGDRPDRAARPLDPARPPARSSPSGASCPQGAGLIVGVNVCRPPARRARASCLILADALASTGLDPRALRLEVKENDAQPRAGDDVHRALEHAQREHGVRSHIDDFGTGASLAAPAAPLPGRRGEDLTARW